MCMEGNMHAATTVFEWTTVKAKQVNPEYSMALGCTPPCLACTVHVLCFSQMETQQMCNLVQGVEYAAAHMHEMC